MKTRDFLLLVSLTTLSNFSTFSQTVKDIFKSKETSILFLGVDFSQARLIDESDVSLNELKDRYFGAINEVVINEPKKYDIANAFRKKEIDHDISIVSQQNKTINMDLFLSNNTKDFKRLTSTDIENAIKKYDFKNNTGIGLLFFVEGMAKSLKGESVWVTFVDMKNKKVLLCERVVGKTRGAFGFRNFWAAPIADIIDQIDADLYKDWSSKYAR